MVEAAQKAAQGVIDVKVIERRAGKHADETEAIKTKGQQHTRFDRRHGGAAGAPDGDEYQGQAGDQSGQKACRVDRRIRKPCLAELPQNTPLC